ncbi:MAG TPA: hypothetical protein VL463_13110 [Kofleriaceae bacterium]|nr:hypothetical protein [Kofleriaceae bacterium]
MAIDVNEQDPCHWLRIKPGVTNLDKEGREFTRRDENGKIVKEKTPQRARDESGKLLPGKRWIRYIHQNGTDARDCISNGASHLEAQSSYEMAIRRKARQLGWIEIDSCPVKKHLLGELDDDQIVDAAVREAVKACPDGSYSASNPCPHLIAERDARRAANAKDWADRAAGYRTEADKIMEASNQNAAAIREGIKDLVQEMRGGDVAPTPMPRGKRAKAEEDT